MKSREAIYQHVVELMSEMFELDPEAFTEGARLYDDLDIDSIDAVDLIVELKAYTGRKIAPDDFRNVRTVGDVVTAVEDLLEDE